MRILKYLSILERALTPNHPLHAQWFITRRCNYKCKTCNVWEAQEKNEIGLEETLYGLDVLRDLGVAEITFSGGNPLLRDDIGEILRYSSKHFITTIYDNGSMIKKRIEDLKYVDFVAISLDSLEEEKQDYIKGVEGSFRDAIESAKLLRKEGIKFAFSTTISNLNLEEIIPMVRCFERIGVPFNLSFIGFDYNSDSLFSFGKKVDEFVIKDKEKAVKVIEELKNLGKKAPLLLPLESLDELEHYIQTRKRKHACGALKNFLMLDHLGRISGCHLKEPVSTIYDIKDFWYSEEAEKIRRENERCNACSYICYLSYSLPLRAFVRPLLIGIRTKKKY
ncbi:MAG: radical SAM protein [Candidatus Aenigmarchaeota archaeon]|nr:radical SAM protein [Candidatus Aenigmarchaeota archaeon]